MTVASETAEAVLALRRLCLAVAAARPDGAEVLASLQAGTCRIVLDERSGTLGIGITGPHVGDPVQWLETLGCHPGDPATFGRLESLAVLAAPGGPAH